MYRKRKSAPGQELSCQACFHTEPCSLLPCTRRAAQRKASMAAAERPRTAVYCNGSMSQITRAARQRMEFEAKSVRQKAVERKSVMAEPGMLWNGNLPCMFRAVRGV